MTGILAILIGYYIYLFGKGLVTSENPFNTAWFISLLILVLLIVAFIFTVRRAVREGKARKEEEAKIKAEYERKRAEKAKKSFDFEEFKNPVSDSEAPSDDNKSIYDS